MKTKLVLAAVALFFAGFAYPQVNFVGSGGIADMEHQAMAATHPLSTKAYETAMSRMMTDMIPNYTDKPDADFAAAMIPHHKGAIAMAKVALQYGKDADIRKLAEDVIKKQKGEIAILENWLLKADQGALVVTPESTAAYRQIMATMMKDMMVPYAGDADIDFARGMIPHHQGAIDMARVALLYARDPDILKLAQDVVAAQTVEIAFLQDWLKRKEA